MPKIICKTCGKEFKRKLSHIRKNNFCSRQCLAKFKKGSKHTEKAKRNMSLAQKSMENHSGRFRKGHKSGMFGKHHSEKSKRKMSISAVISIREKPHGFQKGHTYRNTGRTRFKEGQFGKEAGHWINGKTICGGYILIFMPEHPFCNKDRYVLEHRLAVEQQIGRYLMSKEICHHINGIKTDNRPENLMAFKSKSAHNRFHKDPNRVKPHEIIFDGRQL